MENASGTSAYRPLKNSNSSIDTTIHITGLLCPLDICVLSCGGHSAVADDSISFSHLSDFGQMLYFAVKAAPFGAPFFRFGVTAAAKLRWYLVSPAKAVTLSSNSRLPPFFFKVFHIVKSFAKPSYGLL